MELHSHTFVYLHESHILMPRPNRTALPLLNRINSLYNFCDVYVEMQQCNIGITATKSRFIAILTMYRTPFQSISC